MGGYQAVESNYDIQYKRTHTLRAVKSIEKTDWSTRRHVLEEIEMLKAVSGKHPNIIEYIEYYEEWGMMNLIFEYCSKGTVDDLIVGNKAPSSEEGAASLTYQLIDALAFIKEKQILHRDVKPANLLMATKETLKLADFGIACYCEEPLRTCEGTPAFFPPEIHQLPRGKGYSFPMDIWAAGISIYMLLFKGAHPFNDRGTISKELLRNGEFQVGWLTSMKARDFLEWLLMPMPDQRILPEDALKHAWFASCGLGSGGFAKERPRKLVLDSHGNWLRGN